MSANNNEKLDKILNEAIELQEKGKSIPEILNLFPEHKETLQEIFQIITILKTQKEQIAPTKELLAQIISRLKVNENVTKQKLSRYLYYRGAPRSNLLEILRGKIKGRPSIIQLFNVVKFSDMIRKSYIGIGVIGLVVLVAAGVYYWQSQKVTVSPIESEVSYEEEILSQDIAELEDFSQDVSLDSLDEDLADIAEEKVVSKEIEIASIENLESELSLELNGLSTDLSDLEGFEGDVSLDNLDSGLSQVVEFE